jgi:hypothetical protein
MKLNALETSQEHKIHIRSRAQSCDRTPSRNHENYTQILRFKKSLKMSSKVKGLKLGYIKETYFNYIALTLDTLSIQLLTVEHRYFDLYTNSVEACVS